MMSFRFVAVSALLLSTTQVSAASFEFVGSLQNPIRYYAPDGGNSDSVSIATDGKTAVVGRWGWQEAQVYDLTTLSSSPTGSITPIRRLEASNPRPADGLGYSVGLSGNRVFAGAHGRDELGPEPRDTRNFISNVGAFYEFDLSRTPATGTEIRSSGQEAHDGFGREMASNADHLLVSSYSDLGGISHYDLRGPTLQETRLAGNTRFRSFDLDGDRAYVASLEQVNGVRTNFVYEHDLNNPGSAPRKINTSGPGVVVGGASSLAVSGDYVVTGMRGSDDKGKDSGAATLFDLSTSKAMTLSGQDTQYLDRFGASVDIDGRYIVIGARSDRNPGHKNGSMYLFDAVTGEQLDKTNPDEGEFATGANVKIFGDLVLAEAGHGVVTVFRIKDYEALPSSSGGAPTAAVPLPHTALMMIGGLLGLLGLRRRA